MLVYKQFRNLQKLQMLLSFEIASFESWVYKHLVLLLCNFGVVGLSNRVRIHTTGGF